MNQTNLFQKYCIDTSAILDFWDTQDRTRPYHVKVKTFRTIWNHVSSEIDTGVIIVPKIVAEEAKTIAEITHNTELEVWIEDHKSVFLYHDQCLDELKRIITKYTIYQGQRGSLADAIVVATGMKNNITVITSESHVQQHSLVKPKIPNVCEDLGVNWIQLPEFFESEGL